MRTISLFILLSGSTGTVAHAQVYCEPSFANGCFNWQNIGITVSNAAWDSGNGPCEVGDHTNIVAVMDAGATTPMTVTNGVWCGCAVWVDLDQSGSFEPLENVFFAYNGADPSQTYSFELTLPEDLESGNYRMRVIAPWGSDGFTQGGQNGSGPCGAYQYGNYTDLTINVIGAAQVQEVDAEGLWVGPNPGDDQLRVRVPRGLRSLQVITMDGRMVSEREGLADTWIDIDMRNWPTGSYVVRAVTGAGVLQARWLKQ